MQQYRSHGRPTPTIGEALAWETQVLSLLVFKEFRGQYRGAFLGATWALINPLLLMGVYSVLFAGILKVGIPDYPVFVLAGLIPWTFFSSGLSQAANALVVHLPILRSHRVPPRLFPTASCLASGVHLLIALALFAFYRTFHGLDPAAIPWLGPILVVQLMLTLGLGLGLSAINALHRDTHQALLFVLRVWFFLTPVVYAAGQVPDRLRSLLWANPMSGLVLAYRRVLIDGRCPSPESLASALAWAGVLLALGLVLTRRVAPRLPEVA